MADNTIPLDDLIEIRDGYASTLPERATVIRPSAQMYLGPFPAYLLASVGNPEIWAGRLGTRKGYTVYLACQTLWRPETYYGLGHVIVSSDKQYAGVCSVAGVSGIAEPDFSQPTVTDGAASWSGGQAPSTVLTLLDTDRIFFQSQNLTLDILDLTQAQSYQFRIAAICVIRKGA